MSHYSLSNFTKKSNTIAILLIFFSMLIALGESQTNCEVCRCRHYVWMGICLIVSVVLNVILIALIGIIIFKVCVLNKERQEDTDVDRRSARRLPYAINFTYQEQPTEVYGVQQKILGLQAYEHRIALSKAYRSLWTKVLFELGKKMSNEQLDIAQKLLSLGVLEVKAAENYLRVTTQHRYEKENKKLKVAMDTIKMYNDNGRPLEPINHIIHGLYDALYRLAHNRSEDIITERIFINEDDPMHVVKPEFKEYIYPNIINNCSISEITNFFKNLIETAENGEEIKADILELAKQSGNEILPSIIEQIQIPEKKNIDEVELEVKDMEGHEINENPSNNEDEIRKIEVSQVSAVTIVDENDEIAKINSQSQLSEQRNSTNSFGHISISQVEEVDH